MRKLSLFLLSCCLVFPASSQWIHYTNENTSRNSGEVVCSIISDSQDNVWFATNRGIVKFDKNFGLWNTFRTSDNESNDFIYQVFEDKQGNIWTASNGGGVSCYRGGLWYSFTIKNGLPSNIVRSIAQTSDGILWFGTYGKGLVSFTTANVFTPLNLSELKDSKILSLLALEDGGLLIGTKQRGLFKLNGDSLVALDSGEGLISNMISCIYRTEAGEVWIGTDEGAQEIDVEMWQAYPCPDELEGSPVFSICCNNESELLFGSENLVFKKSNNEYTSFIPADTVTQADYYAIHYDHDGNGWFGTLNYGMFFYDGSAWINYYKSAGLKRSAYYSICEDKDKDLWFCSYDQINTFDGINWKLIASDVNIFGYGYRNFLCDHQGNIWFNSDQQVNKYDGDQWTYYSSANGTNFGYIGCLEMDNQGNIWVGTYYNGVFKFDGTSWINYTTNDGLASNMVAAMDFDNKGRLFTVSFEAEISIYKEGNWSVGIDFNHEFMTCEIFADSKNNLWLGSYDRIIKLSGAKVETYFLNEWNQVNRIEEDSYGKIWVSRHGSGLYVYDGSSWEKIPIDNNWNSNYINNIFFDSEENIWLATNDGIYCSNELTTIEPISFSEANIFVCYPNPFRDKLEITFGLTGNSPVELSFYTLDGRKIMVLKEQFIDISNPTISIDTHTWPKGIIICQAIQDNRQQTKKIIKLSD